MLVDSSASLRRLVASTLRCEKFRFYTRTVKRVRQSLTLEQGRISNLYFEIIINKPLHGELAPIRRVLCRA